MSSDKSKKNIFFLLVVVLGFVITVGAFWIIPLDFSRVQNSVINRVRSINWGFGETKVITTTTEKDPQGEIIRTTESEQPQSGKTVWDGLDLLIVPILLAVLGYKLQRRDRENAAEKKAQLEKQREQQAELERKIAHDNLAEEAIQAYLDNMAKLLLDKELRKELFSDVELKSILSSHDRLHRLGKDNAVRDVARTQTITILRRLEGDKERQTRIIHFLRDAELLGFVLKNANLLSANLRATDLGGADLSYTHLGGADLSYANLSCAHLEGADLTKVNLEEADLTNAKLPGATLFNTNLRNAKLNGATFTGALLYVPQALKEEHHLKDAILTGADITSADFTRAKLCLEQLEYVKGKNHAILPKEFIGVVLHRNGKWKLEIPQCCYHYHYNAPLQHILTTIKL